MMPSSVAEQNTNDKIECLHQTTWVWGGNVVSEPRSRSEITHDHPEHRAQSWSPLFLIRFSALHQHFGCLQQWEAKLLENSRRHVAGKCFSDVLRNFPVLMLSLVPLWKMLLQLIKLATRRASSWFWLSAVETNAVGCCRNAAFLFRKRWWSLISSLNAKRVAFQPGFAAGLWKTMFESEEATEKMLSWESVHRK